MKPLQFNQCKNIKFVKINKGRHLKVEIDYCITLVVR